MALLNQLYHKLHHNQTVAELRLVSETLGLVFEEKDRSRYLVTCPVTKVSGIFPLNKDPRSRIACGNWVQLLRNIIRRRLELESAG